jgi:hypothetical protein
MMPGASNGRRDRGGDRQAGPTIVLIRGCGSLGREVAMGIGSRGYRPVSIDKRTSAGPAESRRVDLRNVPVVRRELLSLARDRGPAQAIVLLPREDAAGATGERWERTAEELLETTAVIRAAGPVLCHGGRLVLITSGFQDEPSTVRRTTPAEAIVELGAAAVAEEAGVPLVRCLLDHSDRSPGAIAERVLGAVDLPVRGDAHRKVADVAAR